ncbi:MAG: DMT family transporter [Desulfobacterales bacterium]
MRSKSSPSKTEAGRAWQIIGCLCVFASAFFFYMATAVIRWARDAVVIDPSFFAFARFLLGFFIICGLLLIRRQKLKPRRYDLLIGRTLFNCLAVFCFYQAVALTSLAEGNILNMTYPIFLAVLSWLFLKSQRDVTEIFMVVLAFAGVWLILSPARLNPDINNLWGLASGICAAAAIIYLNMSRQHHDSETVLFYMFGLGTLFMYLLFHDNIFVPNAEQAWYLFICALFGVGGQYLLTLGLRYVTALEGGIISSSRILMAAVLGPWVAADPPLTAAGWIGALLIFISNIYLTYRKSKNSR